MNFIKKQAALFSAALLLGACGAPVVKDSFKKARSASAQAYYVPADRLEAARFPPPPAADSDAQKEDMALILDWRGKRTQADCDRANRTFYVTFDFLWGENSPFPRPTPAGAQDFFGRIDSDIGAAVRSMKERYRRPRPDIARPCPGPNSRMKKAGNYSYPSTHAAISRVFAAVLADIAPERKAEFIARADALARDRVIIGVHYPTDIDAGKLFGEIFHTELLKSEAYRGDLEKARTLLVK
jgi:acid phosphatase (class A)